MTIEELIAEKLDGMSFDTEEDMLNYVATLCDDLISDIGRFQRRFENDPRNNAKDCDIEVEEYLEEERKEEEEAANEEW